MTDCACCNRYDFTAREEGELSFRAGDVVDVHDSSDEHWWEGALNGQVGIFPGTYVEIIEEEEQQGDS